MDLKIGFAIVQAKATEIVAMPDGKVKLNLG